MIDIVTEGIITPNSPQKKTLAQERQEALDRLRTHVKPPSLPKRAKSKRPKRAKGLLELETIYVIQDQIDKGYPNSQIANYLNMCGLKSDSGLPWTPSSVAALIVRKGRYENKRQEPEADRKRRFANESLRELNAVCFPPRPVQPLPSNQPPSDPPVQKLPRKENIYETSNQD